MPKVKVNDIEMYYDVFGEGAPFLLIMGSGSTSKDWPQPLLDYFSQHFTIIIFDNRGTGQTTVTENGYTMRQMAEDTAGLIEALNYSKVHILGASMGGMIAQELAINYPEKVDKQVLLCTDCGGPHSIPMSDNDRENYLMTHDPPPGMTEEEIHKIIMSLQYAPRFLEENYDTILQAKLTSQPRNLPRHVIKGQDRGYYEFHDTYDRLPLIKAPTLIVHGDEDRMIPVANGYILHERIPDSVLVTLPETGHMFAEAGTDLITTLMEFLM